MIKSSSDKKYEAVIGLETHCQLNTSSKIFCTCSTKFSSSPNTNICPICLGYPGVLPVLNKEVLSSAVKLGLALKAKIANYSKFDRKQYFYPDLPKNYQISQYDFPIVEGGTLEIELTDKNNQETIYKNIGITRLHMEEDAGKLIHSGSAQLTGSNYSLIDFNRTGIPLLEIVSEPDLRTGQEAAEYAQELRRLVRYLKISDGNMQEGSLRCDVNISVRLLGQIEYGTKVEIKNMNSFSAIQKAIEYEINRQTHILNNNETIFQETRLWDESSQETISMRKKAGASNYRYFPEPDLPPIEILSDQLEFWKKELPELPAYKRRRYQDIFGLSSYDARILSDDREIAEYFEETVSNGADVKLVANWITQEIAAYLNNEKLAITEIALRPKHLEELVLLIEKKVISGKIAKEILPTLLKEGGSPQDIVNKNGLTQISSEETIIKIINEVIEENPLEVDKYKAGKKKLKGFFVGQVMKKSEGRADPKLTNQLIEKKLNE